MTLVCSSSNSIKRSHTSVVSSRSITPMTVLFLTTVLVTTMALSNMPLNVVTPSSAVPLSSVSICFISPARRCPTLGWKLVNAFSKAGVCSGLNAARGNATLLDEMFGGLYNVTVNVSTLQVFQDTPPVTMAQKMRNMACDVIIGPSQSTTRDNTFLDDQLASRLGNAAPSDAVIIDYSALASTLNSAVNYPQYFSLLPQNIPSVVAGILENFGWYRYAMVQSLQLPPVDLSTIDTRFVKTQQIILRNQLTTTTDADVTLLRTFLKDSFGPSDTRIAIIYLGDRHQTFINTLITHLLTPGLYTKKIFIFVTHGVNCGLFSALVGSFCISTSIDLPAFKRIRSALQVVDSDPFVPSERFPELGDYLVKGGFSQFSLRSIPDRFATEGVPETLTYDASRIAIPQDAFDLQRRSNIGDCAADSPTSCVGYLVSESTNIPSNNNILSDVMCTDGTVTALNYLSKAIRNNLPLGYSTFHSRASVSVSSGLLLGGADIAFKATGVRTASRMVLWNIQNQGRLLQVGTVLTSGDGSSYLKTNELGSPTSSATTTSRHFSTQAHTNATSVASNRRHFTAGGISVIFTLSGIMGEVPSDVVSPDVISPKRSFTLLYVVLTILSLMLLLWLFALTYRRLDRVWKYNATVRRRQGGFTAWGGGNGGVAGRSGNGIQGGAGDDDIPENVFIYVDLAHYDSLVAVFPNEMETIVSTVSLILKRAREEAILGAAKWREVTARRHIAEQGGSMLSSSNLQSTEYLGSDRQSIPKSRNSRLKKNPMDSEEDGTEMGEDGGGSDQLLSYDNSTGFGPRSSRNQQQQQDSRSRGASGSRMTADTIDSMPSATSLLKSFMEGLVQIGNPGTQNGNQRDILAAAAIASITSANDIRTDLESLRRRGVEKKGSNGRKHTGGGSSSRSWGSLPLPTLEIIKHIQNRTTVLTTNSIEAALLFSVATHVLLANFKWELLMRSSARLLPAFYTYYDSLLFRELQMRLRRRNEEAWGAAATSGGGGIAVRDGASFYQLAGPQTHSKRPLKQSAMSPKRVPSAAKAKGEKTPPEGRVYGWGEVADETNKQKNARFERNAEPSNQKEDLDGRNNNNNNNNGSPTGPTQNNANVMTSIAQQLTPAQLHQLHLQQQGLGGGLMDSAGGDSGMPSTNNRNTVNTTDTSLLASAQTKSTSTWGPGLDKAELTELFKVLHQNSLGSTSTPGVLTGGNGGLEYVRQLQHSQPQPQGGADNNAIPQPILIASGSSPIRSGDVNFTTTSTTDNTDTDPSGNPSSSPTNQQQLTLFSEKQSTMPQAPIGPSPQHALVAELLRGVARGNKSSKGGVPVAPVKVPVPPRGGGVNDSNKNNELSKRKSGSPSSPTGRDVGGGARERDGAALPNSSRSSSNAVRETVERWDASATSANRPVGCEEIYNNPDAVIAILHEAGVTCQDPAWHPLVLERSLLEEQERNDAVKAKAASDRKNKALIANEKLKNKNKNTNNGGVLNRLFSLKSDRKKNTQQDSSSMNSDDGENSDDDSGSSEGPSLAANKNSIGRNAAATSSSSKQRQQQSSATAAPRLPQNQAHLQLQQDPLKVLQGIRVRVGMGIGPFVKTVSKTGKEDYFGSPLNAASSITHATKPGRTVIVGLLASDRYAFDHVSFATIGDFKVLGSYNISGCAAVQELLEVVAAPLRRFTKSSPLEDT